MPRKTAKDYAAEIRTLKDERDQALEERDEAYQKLEDIDVVLYGDEEDDDDDDDDDDDE